MFLSCNNGLISVIFLRNLCVQKTKPVRSLRNLCVTIDQRGIMPLVRFRYCLTLNYMTLRGELLFFVLLFFCTRISSSKGWHRANEANMEEFWCFIYELLMKLADPYFFLFCWMGTCRVMPVFQFQHIFVRRMSEKVYELGFCYLSYCIWVRCRQTAMIVFGIKSIYFRGNLAPCWLIILENL